MWVDTQIQLGRVPAKDLTTRVFHKYRGPSVEESSTAQPVTSTITRINGMPSRTFYIPTTAIRQPLPPTPHNANIP